MAALQSTLYYLHIVWVGTYLATLSPNPIGTSTYTHPLTFSKLALTVRSTHPPTHHLPPPTQDSPTHPPTYPKGAAKSFSVLAVTQVLLIATGPFWGAMGDRFGGPKRRVDW